jgi:hypothetical protein
MTPALRVCATVGLLAGMLQATPPAKAPRFYPDDPLVAEPKPLAVGEPQRRTLSAALETISNSFSSTGQRQPADGVIPAQGVYTLGEVMDGEWYVE